MSLLAKWFGFCMRTLEDSTPRDTQHVFHTMGLLFFGMWLSQVFACLIFMQVAGFSFLFALLGMIFWGWFFLHLLRLSNASTAISPKSLHLLILSIVDASKAPQPPNDQEEDETPVLTLQSPLEEFQTHPLFLPDKLVSYRIPPLMICLFLSCFWGAMVGTFLASPSVVVEDEIALRQGILARIEVAQTEPLFYISIVAYLIVAATPFVYPWFRRKDYCPYFIARVCEEYHYIKDDWNLHKETLDTLFHTYKEKDTIIWGESYEDPPFRVRPKVMGRIPKKSIQKVPDLQSNNNPQETSASQ